MALYTIGDLHLSLGKDKPMNIFGGRWQDHTEKLRRRWSSLITDEDTVVIPGDFSWATTLDEAREDFRFLASLPGIKIISKGNHDYWWTTGAKMTRFLDECGITNIRFLHNNAYLVDGVIVCGARGWFIEEKFQSDAFSADYDKLVRRECDRLTLSLGCGEEIKNGKDYPTAVFLHFPPVYSNFVCEPLIDVLSEAKVDRVYYGHIHGDFLVPSTVEYRGVKLSLVSADYLDFVPMKVFL